MAAKSVLIVDDQSFVCKALSRELQEGGFEAEHALSGKEALERAQEKKYDLFFVDITMPGMNGVETCCALKKISPESEYVCFTGMYDKVAHKKNTNYIDADGKVKLLYKPFRVNTFLDLAHTVLSNKTN